MSHIEVLEKLIDHHGPVALTQSQELLPVEGRDGIFFPATFAAPEGATSDGRKAKSCYNIDEFADGTNVCLVDSVGSQANRIEPMFAADDLKHLVPQHSVVFNDTLPPLNLLFANHRIADALFRNSGFQKQIEDAFIQVIRGNHEPLARLAPTSLVFGVWDSRGTSAKIPRLLTSAIRAFNVNCHTRSANFLIQSTIDLKAAGILADGSSVEGFENALATRQPGGLQLRKDGSIRRDTTLNLAALRRLRCCTHPGSEDLAKTDTLRRYILSLALIAIARPQETFLRQGCQLVPASDTAPLTLAVEAGGRRTPVELNYDCIVNFARQSAEAFRVSIGEEKPFDLVSAQKSTLGKTTKLKGKVLEVSPDDTSIKIDVRKKGVVVIKCNTNTQILIDSKDASLRDLSHGQFEVEVTVQGEIAQSIKAKGA
jgi:CRISPR-associated protein Csb1